MIPGVTHLPVPSMTVAPAGAATSAPSATTLPSANSTDPRVDPPAFAVDRSSRCVTSVGTPG